MAQKKTTPEDEDDVHGKGPVMKTVMTTRRGLDARGQKRETPPTERFIG